MPALLQVSGEMDWLVYGLLAVSTVIVMIEDIRKQAIPLSGLILFTAAALLQQAREPDRQGIAVAGCLILILAGCQIVFYRLKKTVALGAGDLILIPACGLWLSFEDLPLFIFMLGCLSLATGLLWKCRWGLQTFPMAPAIFASLAFILYNRCH